MLISLSIRDFAIIDALTAEFCPGLQALTGETGAGKSVIIDALGLALGGRAKGDVIRSGAREARVEGLFDISKTPRIRNALKEKDYYKPGDELLISRTVARSGPNRVNINGRTATIAILEEITAGLVDIYGQHEHHSLLSPETHLRVLDNFGDLVDLRRSYEASWTRYLSLKQRIEELSRSEAERAARLDYLRFVIREINSVAPEVGELESLARERDILRNARSIIETSASGYEALYGDDKSVTARIKAVEESLSEIGKLDPRLSDVKAALESARYGIEDAACALRDHGRSVEDNPERLAEAEDRLEVLNRLSKKYGGSIDAVLKYAADSRAELEDLEGGGKSLEEVKKRADKALEEARKLAARLTAGRKKAAARMKNRIERELADLDMGKTRFEARFRPPESEEGLSLWGAETAEFYIAPNVGEEPKPLARIASGGELSRVMLAIKSVLRGGGDVPTLVFDEVDQGVGGSAAESVGRKMRALAENAQVLCVTHLPQIAAFAHNHARVIKTRKKGRTVTRITRLDEDERAGEIARMLAGGEITDATMAVANEMLERASNAVGSHK